jgi:hypothetical protein
MLKEKLVPKMIQAVALEDRRPIRDVANVTHTSNEGYRGTNYCRVWKGAARTHYTSTKFAPNTAAASPIRKNIDLQVKDCWSWMPT